jgi:hypothetical protein
LLTPWSDENNGSDEIRRIMTTFMAMLAAGLLMWMAKLLKEYSLATCESDIRSKGTALPSFKSMLYLQKWDDKCKLVSTRCRYGARTEDVVTFSHIRKCHIDWANKDISSQRMKHNETSLY